MEKNDKTIKLIKDTLDKVRPFIQRDGGDVEFDSFEDGIVYVNMVGACEGCSLINDTLSSGIEIILMEEVPGVVAVRLASDKAEVKKQMEEAANKQIKK
ncbi:MAG: NifU family protein [Bacilli bacterium]